MNIDRELFDEENSYMQNQDKWENFGTQNGIEDDGYDHHSLHGAPRLWSPKRSMPCLTAS